jgi:hypothetical protein
VGNRVEILCISFASGFNCNYSTSFFEGLHTRYYLGTWQGLIVADVGQPCRPLFLMAVDSSPSTIYRLEPANQKSNGASVRAFAG